MSDKLPKVNIAVAASAVVAIVSTIGGGIWYASSQASIIEGLTSQDIYSEFEIVYDDMSGFLVQFNQIVQLQARIKTLENTLEYLTRSPIHSDGR